MRSALAAVLAAALAAGCAWARPKADPTEFFVLEAAPSPKAPRKQPPLVELAEVEVPEYLRGPRMAARSRGNEIEYDEFRRWAEPLPQGIARVLKENLAATADVSQAPVPGRKPAYLLSVRVSAFEGLRLPANAGSVSVAASWELRPAGKPSARGRFASAPAAWDGKDYRALARLESEALAALCRDLSRALLEEQSHQR
jgi:uncharacterized lipoprotein YmbA